MKRKTLKLLKVTVLPIAAGLLVGTLTSQLTMNYLDRRLEQMIVERQSTGTAGSIAAVSKMNKSAIAPYRVRQDKAISPIRECEDVAGLSFTDEESQMLLKLAMAEAGNQGTVGKALVINVVHNRVLSNKFPNSIEEVIFQENQFTPISDGRYETAVPDEECFEALEMVLSYWDGSDGALYFEADYSTNAWHKQNLTKLFQYGNLIFYKGE